MKKFVLVVIAVIAVSVVVKKIQHPSTAKVECTIAEVPAYLTGIATKYALCGYEEVNEQAYGYNTDDVHAVICYNPVWDSAYKSDEAKIRIYAGHTYVLMNFSRGN